METGKKVQQLLDLYSTADEISSPIPKDQLFELCAFPVPNFDVNLLAEVVAITNDSPPEFKSDADKRLNDILERADEGIYNWALCNENSSKTLKQLEVQMHQEVAYAILENLKKYKLPIPNLPPSSEMQSWFKISAEESFLTAWKAICAEIVKEREKIKDLFEAQESFATSLPDAFAQLNNLCKQHEMQLWCKLQCLLAYYVQEHYPLFSKALARSRIKSEFSNISIDENKEFKIKIKSCPWWPNPETDVQKLRYKAIKDVNLVAKQQYKRNPNISYNELCDNQHISAIWKRLKRQIRELGKSKIAEKPPRDVFKDFKTGTSYYRSTN